MFIQWADRNGNTYSRKLGRAAAEVRLAYLDEVERTTQQKSPTDSGMVRYCYNAEAAAIRRALSGGAT